MTIQKTDLIGEYLREVDLRLSGLPLLERRELLADLEAHIATERGLGAYSETEMIEVLRRLGTPEEVAAAAYWEAGPQPPRRGHEPAAPKPRGGVPGWVIAMIIGFAVLFMIGAGGLLLFSRGAEMTPRPTQQVAVPADAVEEPPPAPLPTE